MRNRIRNTSNKFYTAIILLLFFLFTSEYIAQTPNQIVVYKTIDSIKLKLFVFTPLNNNSAVKKPAIVFFHGGGWNNGSPKSFFRQSEYLASRGIVAISAQYRLRDSNGTTPKECVKDSKSAIRWVRAHALEFGIDSDRIAAGGGSAGGHIAAAAATLKFFDEDFEDKSISSKPNALVLFNPVIDNGPDGYGYERVKEYWQEFSPLHNLSLQSPPTLFMLGTADHLIPVSTGEKYKNEMEKLGIRCDLILYENEKHGFYNKSKYFETLLETDKFLKSMGYLEGEPTLKPDNVK